MQSWAVPQQCPHGTITGFCSDRFSAQLMIDSHKPGVTERQTFASEHFSCATEPSNGRAATWFRIDARCRHYVPPAPVVTCCGQANWRGESYCRATKPKAVQGAADEAIPSLALVIPSFACVTDPRIPSNVPSNHGFRLADENMTGFISERHKDGPSNAPLGDGRNVGIGSVFRTRKSVLAYERCPTGDNRVGVTGGQKTF